MTYNLPAHGEGNWDGKLSPSMQYLKDTAEAAETPAGAQAKADSAYNAAVSAAATDATTKANNAQNAAINAAATDATTKANSVQSNLNTHTGNLANPHSVTKAQVGLGNVDNTSDASKPVSTAQQTALNSKQDTATLDADVASKVTSGTQTPAALGKAYAPGVSVKAHGATGDGTTDDTTAIQAAINANAGGTVYFPAGDYRINVTAVVGSDSSNVGLRLTSSGTTLLLHENAKLRALASSSTRYAVIEITATDCAVIGGQIVGDVGSHVGTTGEWGHGISIMEAAHRTRVERVYISKCWGDGICVGDSAAAFNTGARPTDVQITNVVCDNNRRQGISIIAALRAQINGGSFINTGQTAYTAPGAGIGVESNSGGQQKITDLVITGAIVTRNKGRGLYCNSAGNELTATLNGVRSIDNDSDGFSFDYASEVTLNGCHAHNNGVTALAAVDGFIVNSTATAKVKFSGCTARGNRRFGFAVVAPDITLAACGSWGNGWAGFYASAGRATLLACESEGNNQVSNSYGNIHLDGGSDSRLIGCMSRAGTGATKAGWGYQIAAGVTGAWLVGCDALGAFTAGVLLDSGTSTNARPTPGAAKQTGTPAAATDAATTQALVNDIRTKLIALGLIS